jgi:ABC-type transport system involved in Fe-S cluster assembly fused permease/ATPase subunit
MTKTNVFEFDITGWLDPTYEKFELTTKKFSDRYYKWYFKPVTFLNDIIDNCFTIHAVETRISIETPYHEADELYETCKFMFLNGLLLYELLEQLEEEKKPMKQKDE